MMVPSCGGDTSTSVCNCGSTGCTSGCDYCATGTQVFITATYVSGGNHYDTLEKEEMVEPRWHPVPKELRSMFPEIKVKPHKIVFSKPKFNRKLLFSFSGYLPKRVRRRVC